MEAPRPCPQISIHALRGEGDEGISKKDITYFDFNPRPPWGGRQVCSETLYALSAFQSTPSVGRATIFLRINFRNLKFQSTPSVGRATRRKKRNGTFKEISIHALRGEGDCRPCTCVHHRQISIHALRGEGDKLRLRLLPSSIDFNPRPPWGGRPGIPAAAAGVLLFQSTPSVGRATTYFESCS